ncbi:MAG: ABC transporter permease [Bacteroidales bacterium]|nr:ABC transporter permease [Bacteroidales bacterium]
MLAAIAWRNVWRNRRRTLIAAASVFTAMVLSLFMLSMKQGSLYQMIAAGVNQVGNLQIHDTGYWENKSLDRAFFEHGQFNPVFKSIPEITRVVPHLQTFSLASYGKQTKGIVISGIDPRLEDQQSGLSRKIIDGHYLSGRDEVLIGELMATYLKMNVGDSIVLLGQGYRGITAYGIYKVAGIFNLPSREMNSNLLYMGLKDAQDFVYPYEKGLLTGYSIYLKDGTQEMPIKKQLEKQLGKKYEIISWRTILSDMLQTISVGKISNQVFVLILYLIAAFGIFSTVLMMTIEKRKEYAIMIALGMQRGRLVWVSVVETIIVSIVGVLAALTVMVPLLTYMHFHPVQVSGEMAKIYVLYNLEPIMPFLASPELFLSQAAIILGLSFFSAVYPILYILKFNVLNAYRH